MAPRASLRQRAEERHRAQANGTLVATVSEQGAELERPTTGMQDHRAQASEKPRYRCRRILILVRVMDPRHRDDDAIVACRVP